MGNGNEKTANCGLDSNRAQTIVMRYLHNRRAEEMSKPLGRYIAIQIVTDKHASHKPLAEKINAANCKCG